ncbi:MAG: hypothetical protein JWR72_4054 [Flavisolibacter sp.]|nr:hypothetical protein [Flavisolibacter sp.]
MSEHSFSLSRPGTSKFWLLIPLAGCLVFILLYIIAAALYPGGSHADVHSKGFSWQHNYWCNLLDEKAMNGEYNDGRYVAIAAMAILAITLLSFWIISANLLQFSKRARTVILFSGLLSMAVLPFLSTSLHDTIINSSGFFGLVAMTGTYIGIYRNKWYRLFMIGILNLLLIGINNYIYYSENLFYLLPVVQKITFLSCLVWISLVDIKFYRRL